MLLKRRQRRRAGAAFLPTRRSPRTAVRARRREYGAAVRDGAVRELGTRIRTLRLERRRTLRQLADATGLSVSMVSMLERGRANPSIGTLVATAAALGVPMTSLFGDAAGRASPVIPLGRQPVMRTRRGVRRRLVIRDPGTNIEVAENTYAPGTASADVPIRHIGREMGLLLEGVLAVQVGGERYTLHPGDAVVIDSARPHRFVNVGRRMARTIWINVHGGRRLSSKGGVP
jgi:transcriptional regulator with XRE-family HTH domain